MPFLLLALVGVGVLLAAKGGSGANPALPAATGVGWRELHTGDPILPGSKMWSTVDLSKWALVAPMLGLPPTVDGFRQLVAQMIGKLGGSGQSIATGFNLYGPTDPLPADRPAGTTQGNTYMEITWSTTIPMQEAVPQIQPGTLAWSKP